jgi:hypothetical protein
VHRRRLNERREFSATQQGVNMIKILLSGVVIVVVGSAGELSAGAQPLDCKQAERETERRSPLR